MNIKLVGIDGATKKTGVCLLVNGELEKYTLVDTSKITDKRERFVQMSSSIKALLNEWKPDIVIMEDSWNAANVEVTKLLSKLMGTVDGWCIDNNVEYHEVLPTVWRKYAHIDQSKKKREELKQASVQYVYDKYGVEVIDDIADSIAMADAWVNVFNEGE